MYYHPGHIITILTIHLSINPSIYPSICQSIYLSIHLSINASIYLCIYLSINVGASQQDLVIAASIMRCNNPANGDFQCNNAMSLSKWLKSSPDYSGMVMMMDMMMMVMVMMIVMMMMELNMIIALIYYTIYIGPSSPKDIATRLISLTPINPLISSLTAAPNGFINITLSTPMLVNTINSIVKAGVKPPTLAVKRVLVDFSSPNIAKEMHVVSSSDVMMMIRMMIMIIMIMYVDN